MLKFTFNITTQEMYTVIPVHVLMKCQLNNNCYMSKKSMHTSVCENDVYFSMSSNFTTRSDLYQSDATQAGGSWEKIIITITYVHVFQYLNQNLRDSDYSMFWGGFPVFQNCENGINV